LRGMADFAVTDNLFARVSGLGKSVDGHVQVLDYGLTHPNSNVPANNARGPGNPDHTTQGGMSTTAGRLALRWIPTDRLEVNVAADDTSQRGEAGPTVVIAAGAVSDTAAEFDPFSTNPATNANGGGWLVGRDGNPVPLNCAFVPAGPYSCDTLSGDYGDPRYISYANFIDAMVPT